MLQRLWDLFQFQLERMFLRGAHMRLLVIAALIGLISTLGGVLVMGVDPSLRHPGEAIWWAFLRLSDPGYLGDDVGSGKRAISAVLTVLGYVVFLGALVAIMTQWLQNTLRRLESGLTPIAQNHHVLILGWTHQTPILLRDLMRSEGRVERFLSRRGVRALRVVLLAEEVTAALAAEVKESLGEDWREPQITLRTGSALKIEHLRRVDFENAAVIVLPATDVAVGGTEGADARTLKSLVSMAPYLVPREDFEPPLVVAELFDATRAPLARHAFPGPLELLASDALIGRLIAQTVRHPGVAEVYAKLLTHSGGSELFIRESEGFAGQSFGSLREYFPRANLIGILRHQEGRWQPHLAPPLEFPVGSKDRLILLSDSFEDTSPEAQPVIPRSRTATAVRHPCSKPLGGGRARRVLLMGFSHKAIAILREFDRYHGERFDIDLLSSLSASRRAEKLQREGFAPTRIGLKHLEGEWTLPHTLAKLDLSAYDNIVILASDRTESEEEADARSLLGYLVLRERLPVSGAPAVLVELLDETNAGLFADGRTEILVTPLILSHVMAQVALRRELGDVLDELFGPGGTETLLRSALELGFHGQDMTFAELRTRLAPAGEIPIGVRRPTQGKSAERLCLNPSDHTRWRLTEQDEIVVIRPPFEDDVSSGGGPQEG